MDFSDIHTVKQKKENMLFERWDLSNDFLLVLYKTLLMPSIIKEKMLVLLLMALPLPIS